jgi:hypothetical protein
MQPQGPIPIKTPPVPIHLLFTLKYVKVATLGSRDLQKNSDLFCYFFFDIVYPTVPSLQHGTRAPQ